MLFNSYIFIFVFLPVVLAVFCLIRNRPNNFMVRMTPDIVPGHIKSRRAVIQRWAQDNPGFVAKFAKERRKWEMGRASEKKNKPNP